MRKIDCSNIFNFISEWNRRAKSTDYAIATFNECGWDENRFQKEVPALQKWSDENPINTREEMFTKLLKENGFERVLQHCKCTKHNLAIPCVSHDCEACKKYWEEEVGE